MKSRCYGIAVLIFVLLTSLFSNSSQAQETVSDEKPVPEVRAYRINPHPPDIDGDLSDPVWQSDGLDLLRSFTQCDPDDGQPATESTVVAIAYDNDALYVAYWCYDSEPNLVARQLVRRDRYSQSDAVTLRLDPFHDHQTGYYFFVSAAGVQRDRRIYDDNNMDGSWDAVWESDVKEQPWGWSAEIKIPYNCIRFPEKEEHTWGVDFSRYINRRQESSVWSHKPQEETGFASHFGHLTGLTGIKPRRHFELLPYVVSSSETMPKSFGNSDGKDFMGNMGLDVKYALSSNLILDATFNPDFGQVELDQPVLNLSAYETYFPERRPFFLEGSDLFRSRYRLFYSRRIGRSPQGGVDDDDKLEYTDYPKATTILGAAKLTGKLASGTSIAFLSAFTAEEKAKYAAHANAVYDTNDSLISADTVYREGVVEPKANYSVLRVKQDVLNNSSVGAMLTLASQETRTPSTTGAFDWRLYTNNRMWSTTGQAVFSRNGADNTGYAFDFLLEKSAGKHTRGVVAVEYKDPDFYINRLGYTNRSDSKQFWSWMQYRTNDDWWIVRNSWNNINYSTTWNFDGNHIGGNWNFNNSVEFVNNWHAGMGYSESFNKYDDRETRGYGLWERPASWNTWFWVNTDDSKKLSAQLHMSYGDSRTNPWWSTDLDLHFRPASNIELSVGGNFCHDFDQLMWVDNIGSAQIADTAGNGNLEIVEGEDIDGDVVLFAYKNQDIFRMSFSASVMLNRNLSCQLSAEGLISGLDYYGHKGLVGTKDYTDQVIGRSTYYDYNYSALNSTLLIRWEYNPGSTLYLVWTRSRSEADSRYSDLDLSRDFDRFFSAGAQNIFLIKASYWLSM